MSVTWRTAAVVVAAGVAAWAGWSWLTTSAEERVLAAVTATAETLSARPTDPLGQVAALGQLRRHLAETVVVRAGGGAEVTGRDAAMGVWQRVRASAEAMRVRVVDPLVSVDEAGTSATVEAVVEVTFERGGVPERELRDVRLTLVERDGEWVVSAASLVEAVTPPG
ncbi:MAG: nuclear transport factor 2 family protein [Vicinamibacterales bacterium]